MGTLRGVVEVSVSNAIPPLPCQAERRWPHKNQSGAHEANAAIAKLKFTPWMVVNLRKWPFQFSDGHSLMAPPGRRPRHTPRAAAGFEFGPPDKQPCSIVAPIRCDPTAGDQDKVEHRLAADVGRGHHA